MSRPTIFFTFAIMAAATAAPSNVGNGCSIGSWARWSLGHSEPCDPSMNTAPTPGNGAQVPFKFPLSSGFPSNVDNSSLTQIVLAAHGSTPNTALPTHLASEDITTFQSIAFNEIFEVAFFSSFIDNVTSSAQGFETDNKDYVLETLHAVVAQEMLHYLGANAILKSAGGQQIQPCEYIFPSDTFASAIDFTRTQTELVLGTLQDAINGLSASGDGALIPLLASVIGNEAEQVGYYRSLLQLVPSELPFLTRSFGPWLYSYLNQKVVVPGSCPNANVINIPIFGELNVHAGPSKNGQDLSPGDTTIEFSFRKGSADISNIALVYVSQQNLPVVVEVTALSTSGDVVTFQANFPYAQNNFNGLTIAAVTKGKGPFASTQDVASATLFGPGLITVN